MIQHLTSPIHRKYYQSSHPAPNNIPAVPDVSQTKWAARHPLRFCANDQVVFEVALNKFFKQAAMQAIGMQTILGNRGVFIHADGVFEDIDGADQHEGVASNGFEVRNQAVDVLAVSRGVTIG
jgi:hypothetical protein